MTAGASRRDLFGAMGVGGVACAACCAGPVLAVLGGITIAGVAGTVVVGAAAAVIAMLAAATVLLTRRRRAAACEVGAPEHVSTMKVIPIYDDTAPIACTITSDEIPARVELIERMRANLGHLERTEHGLLLHFPVRDDIDADLQRFAIDEKRCCEFWGFEVARAQELTLRWDAPPTAGELIDRLESFFEGDEPALDLAGLL